MVHLLQLTSIDNCDYLKSILERMVFCREMELKFHYLLWSVALGIKPKTFDILDKCPIIEPHPGALIS